MRVPSKTLSRLLGAVLLSAAAASGVSAQESAPADTPDDADGGIVVTARPEPTAREAYEQAVELSRVGPYQLYDEALPRFWAPVCPGVAGLRPELAGWIVGRIRANAQRAGIAVGRESCSPNLVVAFVDSGRTLLADLERQQPGLFRQVADAEKAELLSGPGPVRVWSNMAWRWTAASPPPSGWPKMRGSSAGAFSRVAMPEARDIVAALVVVDRSAAEGKTAAQLADYATMRGLSHTRPAEGDEALATILSLFAGDGGSPAELTPFDIGYLRSLYESIPNRPAANRLLRVRALASKAGMEPAPERR